MRRAPAIVTLLLFCILFAYSFLQAGRIGWARLQDYPGRPLEATAPTTPPTPATSAAAGVPQVVVVVVDGLQAADALRLPALARLADSGAFFTLRAPTPTWPGPSWATLLTGRRPAEHGVVLATEDAPPQGPNLLAALVASGRRVALAGGEGLLDLFGPWANAGQFAIPGGWEGTGQPFLEAADQALATQADLVVIHLEGLHTVVHRLLGTEGPADGTIAPDPSTPAEAAAETESEGEDGEKAPRVVPWDEALGWIDVRLALLLERMDPGATVVVVGSYGATPEGRHGDPALATPLVVAGPRAGAEIGHGDLLDVAPTLAALLQVPYPGVEGRPLPGAVTGLQAVASAAAEAESPDWVERATRYWEAVKPRALAGGAVLLLGTAYLWLALRQPAGRLLAVAGGLYLAIHHAVLFGQGFRYRPDLPILEEPGFAFTRMVVVAAAGAMLPVAFLVGLAAGRRGRRPDHSALLGLHLALALMTLLVIGELPVVLYTGWEQPVQWPGSALVLRFFADAIHGAILGFAAPLWAAATGAGAALAASLWPVREERTELRVVAGGGPTATRRPPAGGHGRTRGGGRSPRRGNRRR